MKQQIEALERATQHYRNIVDTAPRREVEAASLAVKHARESLAFRLIADAVPCPSCGSIPHGMLQPNGRFKIVEIGCLPCEDHRAFGPSPSDAAAAWNDGAAKYKPGGPLPTEWIETWAAPKREEYEAKRGGSR